MSNLQGNNNVNLHKFEKVNYFYGQLMTVLDFETERNNFDEKRYLVNRLVHGFGLVYGLSNDDISIPDDNGEDVKIKFEKGGMALDCCGHEIVILPETVNIITEQGTPLKKYDMKKYTYLFLRYKECFGGQKVFAASNPSSCQDICYHNRLKEDFEVVASNTPPGALCGTAGGGDNNSIILEDSTLGENLKDMRITIIEGAGKGQSRKITGYDVNNNMFTIIPNWTTIPNDKSQYRIEFCSDFSNNNNEEEEVRKKIEKWVEIIASYPFCDTDDPKVFLAAIKNQNGVSIDKIETRKYVSIIYNNRLISELLMCHLSHFDNPHRTTAEHVKALKSIHNVGNVGDKYVSNIDLESQNATIKITGDQVNNNMINLETVPATTVTSVNETKQKGVKTSFAREDHIHDLDKNVVKRDNFNEEVIQNLLGSDNKTITISVDKNDNKKINIITAPATTVESVGETKKQGVKTSFAREDHVHDLDKNVVKRDNFNEEVIQNLLVSDETIKIEKDVQNKVIKLSTALGVALDSKTGVWEFKEKSTSDMINPRLGKGPLCVILGLEEGENEPILIGSPEVFNKPQILLGAQVYPQEGTFEIRIKADDPNGFYRVRWWAFKVSIEEPTLKYVTYKVFEKTKQRVRYGLNNGEDYAMVGEKVALNGNPNKLVDLIFNQKNETPHDEYLSNTYEKNTWFLGGGWTLHVKEINVDKSEATIIISFNSKELQTTTIKKGIAYTYIEEEISGESNVPMLVTYFDDLLYTEYDNQYVIKIIRLKYTWVLSRKVKYA